MNNPELREFKNCPRCHGHRWLIWREFPKGRTDLEPMPLFKACELCNAGPVFDPPPMYEPPEEASGV